MGKFNFTDEFKREAVEQIDIARPFDGKGF